MPTLRRWNFDIRGKSIIVIREGEEITSRCGLRYGPVKIVTSGREHAKGAAKAQALLVVFSSGEKGVLARTSFEWNMNSFSQLFRDTRNAEEFISTWNKHTTFNTVTQCAEVIIAQELPDPDPVDVDVDVDATTSPTPPAKRSAESTQKQGTIKKKCLPLDECIEGKKVALLDIPVPNLNEPPPSRLLRKVDNVFVEGLKLRIQNDPAAPGAPPLAVLCKDVAKSDEFNERHKDVYQYEVLGGLHGARARQSLLTEHPGIDAYSRVLCIVYCGLTDEEALRLASRHNINGHYKHKMTHRHYLEACRSRLYVMNGKNDECDDNPPPSLEWKRACSTCILPPDMSRTQRENVFIQASFHKKVWELAVEVMDHFEMGQLKDQKLNRRHLMATPEFKQHLLQPLHHLDIEFQQSVLQRVLDNKLSLAEMKTSSLEFRSLSTVKSTFMRLTSTRSWSEAETKFPQFTSNERLSQYTSLSFKNGIPDHFRIYCQAALDSKNVIGSIPESSARKQVNGVNIFFVEVDFESITAEHIRRIDATFSGAQLMMYRLPKECFLKEAENMAYNSRGVNSLSAGIQCFNLVVLCTMEQQSLVQKAMQKCFDYTELAYSFQEDVEGEPPDDNGCLMPALEGIVIGHWSSDGKSHPQQRVNGSHTNVFPYKDLTDLKKQLIQVFSFDTQTVIDADATNGPTEAAKLGRTTYLVNKDASVFFTIQDNE